MAHVRLRWWPLLILLTLLGGIVTPSASLATSTVSQGHTASEASPATCKTEPCGDILTDPWNDRLAITVSSRGRFNIGAFPDPATGGKIEGQSWNLSYRWPDAPYTSFTTLRIDGADIVYGTDGTLVTPPGDVDSRTNRSAWMYGDIKVTQTLQIVPNTQTGREDVARIAYTVQNTGSSFHTVGTRIMIDSEINYNDGAPFRVPGEGILTTEREFVGAAVPATFQTYFGIDDSEHIAASTLKSSSTRSPDRLVFANWSNLFYGTPYNYTVSQGASFAGDSAYAVYWNPTSLAPGQEQTFVTWYGLAEIQVDLRPPLALGVSSPATLTVVNNQYSPDTFTIVATVWNNGTGTANDVSLSLALPPGLTLAAGTPTQPVGPLVVGQEAQEAWIVRAAPQYSPTTLSYTVTAAASNADSKAVTRAINLPLLQRQTQTPPLYTRSYYVETISSQPNRQWGCQARDRGERGVVVLLFGSPRVLRTNSEGDPVYGTRLLANTRRQVSLTQIGSIVRSFAAGYMNGCGRNPAPRPEEADLTIIVATSNSKVGGSDNPVLESGHGEAWANLITTLNRTFQRNYGRSVRAAGGYDAEQEVTEWSSRPPTVEWAERYSNAAQYPYFNVGSCDGCPRTEPRDEWTSTPDRPNNRFAHIQALDEAFKLSWDIRRARSLPQIFYAPYAYQWYNVKRYAREQGRSMPIEGVLGTCGAAAACDFNDPRSWEDFLPVVNDDFLPPRHAWQALYDTLNGPVTPEQRGGESLNVPNPLSQRQLPYLTDVTNATGQ